MSKHRRISKLLSLMLRHRSEEFGLTMDEFGFVVLSEVAAAVQERHPELGEEEIRELVDEPGQYRFEISESGIRALYGHSFFVEMDGEPTEPPERLYLWCSKGEARRYRDHGVEPGDRFYVHLSLSRETAESRSRRVDAPCVVEVLAGEAHAKGVNFYARGEVILTTEVPPEFVGEITGLNEESQSSSEPNFGRKMRRATR